MKLCDFGISGRLVDSKAKTRSAGCAAYMAPERIEPPNPYNPNYDIRADVWSLGITLVEMATGQFPYRDCKTDFELLTKVIQDDPPSLPPNNFSREFEHFVRDCLMKDYKDRPKYKKLLMHPFIKKYEREEVDLGAWYRSVMISTNGSGSSSSLTTPNNNQLIGSLDMTSSNSERTAFKPQPSPRIVRSAWRPPPTTSSTSTTPSSPPSYPSAISEQRENNRRPSFEAMLEQPPQPPQPSRSMSNRGFDISSQYVTSKPPPALPSPVEAISASAASAASTTTSRPSYRQLTSVTDSPMLMRSRRDFNYYEKWQPPKGAHYTALSRQTSSTSSPYSGSYGSPLHYSRNAMTNYQDEDTSPTSQVAAASAASATSTASAMASGRPIMTVPRYGYRESPRTARKFEFTYPQTSYHTSTSERERGHDHHPRGSGEQSAASSFNGGTPSRYPPRRLSTEQHHVLPHHYSQYYQPASVAASTGGRTRGRSPTREPPSPIQPQSPSAQQRSPSQERQQKNYLTSWRSTLSSWTPSFRRLRTASSDRSNFDTSRRFQPSYRSWNEKDNFYPSMKR